MVHALPGVVEGEVLLDHARAEHVAEERHRVAVLVVGEPDHELRKALAEGRDHAQVQVFGLGRIGGRALHDAELRVDGEDRVHRALDVLEGPAAGGEGDRLAVGGDLPEKRRVDEVGRGDLERRHAEFGEEVGAGSVEGRPEQRDPSSRAWCMSSNQSLSESSSASRCSPYVRPKLFSWSYGWSYMARVYSVGLSRFWSLIASAPDSLAARSRSIALISEPWWLCPTSAMTQASPSSRCACRRQRASHLPGDGIAVGCGAAARARGAAPARTRRRAAARAQRHERVEVVEAHRQVEDVRGHRADEGRGEAPRERRTRAASGSPRASARGRAAGRAARRRNT